MRSKVFVLVAVVILASCAKPAGSPRKPAPAAPSDDAKESVACTTERAFDLSYEDRKDSVRGEEKWLRDAKGLTVTFIAPLRLKNPEQENLGSGVRIRFRAGVVISKKIAEGSTTKSVCSLTIQYSDKDFTDMITAYKAGVKYPYPVLLLKPVALRSILWNVYETFTSKPTKDLPNKTCPVEPAISESHYIFSVKPALKLNYPDGGPSKSTIIGLDCDGYNQKGASLLEAFGRNNVGAVEL